MQRDNAKQINNNIPRLANIFFMFCNCALFIRKNALRLGLIRALDDIWGLRSNGR